jgi:hypothetical protein
MSERRDDTTEEDKSSPVKSEPVPGSYYYDDATGYEVYDPARDTDEEGKDERDDDC